MDDGILTRHLKSSRKTTNIRKESKLISVMRIEDLPEYIGVRRGKHQLKKLLIPKGC